MTLVTVFNTTDRPVMLDDEGREVGGHDWGTADTTQQPAKDALGSGSIVKADIPSGGDVNPLAREAADRTARLTDRLAAFGGLGSDELDALGATAGLSGDLTKTELVRALAFREDVGVPSKAASAAATKES